MFLGCGFPQRTGLGDGDAGGPNDAAAPAYDSYAAYAALSGIFIPSTTSRVVWRDCGDSTCSDVVPDYASRAVEDAANRATVAAFQARGEQGAMAASQAGQQTVAAQITRSSRADLLAMQAATRGIFQPSGATMSWDCGDSACSGPDTAQRALDDAANRATVDAFLRSAAQAQADRVAAVNVAAQRERDDMLAKQAVTAAQIAAQRQAQADRVAAVNVAAQRERDDMLAKQAVTAAQIAAQRQAQADAMAATARTQAQIDAARYQQSVANAAAQTAAQMSSAGQLIETDVGSAGGATLYARAPGSQQAGAGVPWGLLLALGSAVFFGG